MLYWPTFGSAGGGQCLRRSRFSAHASRQLPRAELRGILQVALLLVSVRRFCCWWLVAACYTSTGIANLNVVYSNGRAWS